MCAWFGVAPFGPVLLVHAVAGGRPTLVLHFGAGVAQQGIWPCSSMWDRWRGIPSDLGSSLFTRRVEDSSAAPRAYHVYTTTKIYPIDPTPFWLKYFTWAIWCDVI